VREKVRADSSGDVGPLTTDGLLAGETDSIIRQSPPKLQARRGGKRSRQKGDRAEREIVAKHVELGIHSERYPLSGASRFRGSGHDIDIYALGRDAAPLVAECKARKSGGGFVQLEKWLGEYDALFLRRNNADPLIVLPWRVWAQLIKQVRR
jgi:Holliday junction resolvase